MHGFNVLELLFAQKLRARPDRHTRESGYPEVFDFPGFRVALAIASLPGMTPD